MSVGRDAVALTVRVKLMAQYVENMSCLKPAELHDVLADLQQVAWPELLDALAAAVGRASAHYDLSQDDGGDPLAAITMAQLKLGHAATRARAILEDIEAAQSAIAWTGARLRIEHDGQEDAEKAALQAAREEHEILAQALAEFMADKQAKPPEPEAEAEAEDSDTNKE